MSVPERVFLYAMAPLPEVASAWDPVPVTWEDPCATTSWMGEHPVVHPRSRRAREQRALPEKRAEAITRQARVLVVLIFACLLGVVVGFASVPVGVGQLGAIMPGPRPLAILIIILVMTEPEGTANIDDEQCPKRLKAEVED